MRRSFVLGALAGLCLGVSATVGGVALTGGTDTYYLVLNTPSGLQTMTGPAVTELKKAIGSGTNCQPITVDGSLWLRCPRFQFAS